MNLKPLDYKPQRLQVILPTLADTINTCVKYLLGAIRYEHQLKCSNND